MCWRTRGSFWSRHGPGAIALPTRGGGSRSRFFYLHYRVVCGIFLFMYGIQDNPSPAPPPKPMSFAEHFIWYLKLLATVVVTQCYANNTISPLGQLVARRVDDVRKRFVALLERLKFGPLPPPRQRASPRPSATRLSKSPRALPEPGPVAHQKRGWLLHAIPQTGPISQMCYDILLHPE